MKGRRKNLVPHSLIDRRGYEKVAILEKEIHSLPDGFELCKGISHGADFQ
jgi:hypothetical protein